MRGRGNGCTGRTRVIGEPTIEEDAVGRIERRPSALGVGPPTAARRQCAVGQHVSATIPDDRKATEHLANERTFLAWVRTSVSIMSLGFVVAKFGLWLRELASRLSPQTPSHGSGLSGPVGMGMIAFGGALALLAAWRFHTVNRQIERGQFSVDRGLVGLIAIVLAVLAILMMAYIGMSVTAQP